MFFDYISVYFDSSPLQNLVLETLLIILVTNLLLIVFAWHYYSEKIAHTLGLGE